MDFSHFLEAVDSFFGISLVNNSPRLVPSGCNSYDVDVTPFLHFASNCLIVRLCKGDTIDYRDRGDFFHHILTLRSLSSINSYRSSMVR